MTDPAQMPSRAADDAPRPDEWVLDNLQMRSFIDAVNEIRRTALDPSAMIEAIRPHFARLLADRTWLPALYQEPHPTGGMGGGIGTWLLYRAGDGGLAFSSLVVPSGVQTPVHDHLAWGLVGLYRGTQDEEFFRRDDDGAVAGAADLTLKERRTLSAGEFYALLPETDIHRVRTVSDVTSVSLHLLGNDNGCIWRHRFDPETGRVDPFRSGYVNVDCRVMTAEQPPASDLAGPGAVDRNGG